MNRQVRDKVFISYSHKDHQWKDKIKNMLEPSIAGHEIHFWDDTGIETGQNWKDEITAAMDSACVALLLVSDDFCDSDFITTVELPLLLAAAEAKKCTIFWVPIAGESYKNRDDITQFQAEHTAPPLALLDGEHCDHTLRQITGKLIETYRKTKPQNQIKVLSITAAPGDDLQYEKNKIHC